MTTRRSLLGLAGGAAGAALLGACSPGTARPATTGDSVPAGGGPTRADLLFVTTTTGLMVVDASTGKPTLSAPASLASADWAWVVSAHAAGKGTEVVTQESRSGRVISGGTLRDRLEPRVVSPDGRLVALTTPAGGVPAAPYRPAGRARTTVVVADSGGERVRYDLAGNLEPEAFSADGGLLYVLDYLPATAPDRYRVRGLDLTRGVTQPLNTRLKVPVPAGAEEEMRGEGRQAVYDASRRMLFTLYTHQPDHEHTRDLVNGGARDGKPLVHAFVHSLNIEQNWAYCVDLPAPFGEGPPAGHAITQGGEWLYVLDGTSGSLARINPDDLTVASVGTIAARGLTGDAAARATKDGGLVVAAGQRVLSIPAERASGLLRRELPTGTPVRGLAVSRDARRVYVGQDGAVVAFDLSTGGEIARVPVSGLVSVRHVLSV